MRTTAHLMTLSLSTFCTTLLSGTVSVHAYVPTPRRTFLKRGGAALLTAGGAAAAPQRVEAADDNLIDVYFGCGCFWHVQHEFVQAERRILGRGDLELTARTGYAGGRRNQKVCYHNAIVQPDYGKLGHAEVVGLRIPQGSFEAFAREYVKLFDKNGYRPDQFLDQGGEYRNVVGVPKDGPYERVLASVSEEMGVPMRFARGAGGDGDEKALSYVMDAAAYPFYVAEPYHQFHNGFFLNEIYSPFYNLLGLRLDSKGLLAKSKCPNGLLGLGVLGY